MGTIINLIVMAVVGVIIGFIARAIVPGKQDLSLVKTGALGLVGMLVGGIVGSVITPNNVGVPWIAGILCTVVILFALVRTGTLSKIQ